MKSFFVFCVLKFITALAQKTNGEINEGHKKHGADGDIFKDDNFIFNGDKDIIAYMVQTPLKHQNYNQLNSKQENKVERHKMIIENNLPFSNLEDVRYDPANVETGTDQRRRNSNSNSGVNINNNVSDNKEGVEINNIQQENKKSDSKLKANFIEWINNSYLQNYTPDKKSDSDSLSQEYIEDEESSNANNDVNINNNVNNNLQKVQINNVQQKNELNRRRMNINSNLNANLFKKNIGNSYLETNEENQSSALNFLPFNGHTRRNVNSNVNSDVNINNDVHNNLDKIDLDNIQQNNEINWRRMDLQSTLNTQISPKNNKNSQVQHKSVNQISLNSYPSQGPIRRKVNSNVNSGININNDIHDNLDKIELDNIQQKNEQTSRIMDLQYALNAQTSPKNNKNGQIRSNSVNQISLNSYPSQGPTRRKVNSNVNSGININNDIHDNWDKIELDNIQQKNEQTRRIIDLQSALNAQISPKNNKNGQIRSNSVNQISLNSYPSQGPTRRNVNSNVNSGININNDVYGNLDKVQLENIQQKNEENRTDTQSILNTDLSKENKENEQEVDLLALLSPKKNLPEKIKVNINKKLNINNNLNHNVQKVIISNINQKNKENIKKMNVQSILSYFSYFVHHPPKDKNLNALKRKKETYMIMLSYFIKYLGEMGVPDSEILYYIEQAQSYESDAEIREIYNKLIHSYQSPSQTPDIDDRISETPVTIIPDRPEEVNPDDSNPEDEGNIRDKNFQLILNNFDHLLHNAPKDENLSALRQKKKTYLIELIDYIKYLEAIGVPDSKILWYLQEAQKYESDEELKEKYNTLIHSYQNPSQNPGIDEILSETPVTIIPDRPEEINPDESYLEDGESISDKNIQLILSKFNHFLRNSPKDEDLVALKQRRKTYLLELINFIKYLEAIGVPDLKILWYLQEAQKYESDEELREKYNTLIHSYQNSSQNPDIDDEISETPVTIIPDRPEEINPDASNPEDGESISDKNIQLILSKFNHFLRNSPKDEDLVALKQRRKTYLLELINFIKYLEAIGIPDLKILWYLQEAQKYKSDEELREKYNTLIHSYQNPSQNPGIDDILSETPVTIIPDRPEEINPDESNLEDGESISDKNIQLILSKFNHFLRNSPKDEDLVALKQRRKTYLLELINFIKYLEAIGVPDLKILWYLQEAQKYESDEELREKYKNLIHSYQNPSQNPGIDDILSETPVTIIPDRPEEINPENGESVSDKNIQLILSKFNHFLHNSPKDEDLVALKQKRKTYLLQLINFIKYLEAIGIPDLKILWYLQEAQKYESDEELREKYNTLIHSYQNSSQNPDIDDEISETPVTIIPDRLEEINPDASNLEDGESISDKNIQLILSKFNHFLHNSPKDEDLVALKQKRKTYLLELINFIKYLEAIGVPDLKILWYLQEARKYEFDEELREKYKKLIHSYQNPSQNSDIDDILSETPVTIIPDRPEEINPDASNLEDGESISDKNIQLILSKFNHFLHNSPKDEDLVALKQKRKTYLLELINFLKYLEAIGVPDLKILWYLQEARKYEFDEELREIYKNLIDSYQNPDIDDIISETPVTIIPDRPEEINPDESNQEDGENINDKNIQLILSKFNHFLHNSPKDEDLVALKQKRKTYLLQLINFIKYLEVISVPDSKILLYLQEAQKYESDEELKVIYLQIIHSYEQQQTNGNKKPSPPSEEILPNNITEKIEKEPEHNNESNTFRPTEKNDNDMVTEAPTPDETTPHWKPEDIPTPYWEPESTPAPHWEPENTPAPHWEPENTPAPHWEPENTPAPHWEPENTPPPCWAPENEPIPSSTEIPIVNPPNILDLLNPPYNVHLNKYVDDTITYLIQHLKRNGVSNEEIQKIVQMSLINVIKSMTQYTISEYQGKILNEIRHNLQSSLYRYMLLKCCHTMN